jgi:hypothetical protein
MRRLHTHGQYAEDGKERRLKVREEAGHRCIRCHHPFETGKHGKGEWSPCDSQCVHGGPIRYGVEGGKTRISTAVDEANKEGVRALLAVGFKVEAQWRILTVHHFDGDKANDAWWNTIALCQRCHLQIQCNVDPDIPFFLEHTEWAKPYVAGFYAFKYEGRMIDRDEAIRRMDELLAYENMEA